MMPAALGFAFGFQSSACSSAWSGIEYAFPLSISQNITAPSLERPTCLNRSSSDSMFSPPSRNGRVRLRLVAFWSGHPPARLKVEFPDEFPILAHMAVQGRMIGLVHRDLEPAYGPFSHVRPGNLCYHVITQRQVRRAAKAGRQMLGEKKTWREKGVRSTQKQPVMRTINQRPASAPM